uniref:Uncharacterized protein n=1 Tax=viral metagenome TaxID=1070528 RepID=A0A6C0ADU4_9ZZZZ
MEQIISEFKKIQSKYHAIKKPNYSEEEIIIIEKRKEIQSEYDKKRVQKSSEKLKDDKRLIKNISEKLKDDKIKLKGELIQIKDEYEEYVKIFHGKIEIKDVHEKYVKIFDEKIKILDIKLKVCMGQKCYHVSKTYGSIFCKYCDIRFKPYTGPN